MKKFALIGPLALGTLFSFTGAQFAVAEESIEFPAFAAIDAISKAGNVDLEVARNFYIDQSNLLELLSSERIELDELVDVWVDSVGETQFIHVRTRDAQLAESLLRVQLSEFSTVVYEDEDPVDAQRILSENETIQQLIATDSSIQGAYVSEVDGSVVFDVSAVQQQTSDIFGDSTRYSSLHAIIVGGSASDSLTVRGGTATSVCTAGFAAKYGSYIGYLSAAHCGVTDVYFSSVSATGSSTAATRRTSNYGANADIGFFSVGSANSIEGSFFGSSSSIPTVETGAQSVPVGVTVCRRGQVSGWDCGAVTSINYQPTWSNACPGTVCNPVFIRVDISQQHGDSGGPWVAGSHAVGIHKGGASNFCVFSSISRIPSGVFIY